MRVAPSLSEEYFVLSISEFSRIASHHELLSDGCSLDVTDESRNRVWFCRRQKFLVAIQADGSGMIGYQPIHGLNTFRMIAMNTSLQTTDVDALLDAISSGGAVV